MTSPAMTETRNDPLPPHDMVWVPLFLARGSVTLLLLAGWELTSRSVPDLVAPPLQTLVRLAELMQSGALAAMVWTTLAETAGGLLIGAGLGVVLPFLVQMSPRWTAVIEPFAQAGVGVPKLALSPILLVWFGIGMTGKVVLVALMTFFLVFVATFSGIRSVGPSLIRTVSVFGASRVDIAREVLWHSAQPFVWAALRAALPWAINAALVGEFLAAHEGIGHYIHHSYNLADITGVYAGILATVVLILVADTLLGAVQRRSLAWRPQQAHAIPH
jgi:NitT/TauT family transport system permease protein